MGNEIIATSDMPVGKYNDDANFGAIATSASWLSRVQLFGAASKEVKRGKIPMGTYGMVRSKDDIEHMGPEFDCLVLGWRPMAMRIDGDDVTSIYNPANAEFAKIQAESEDKDSGCMYGPQFLLWLAQQQVYVTIFCNSKTMRRAAPDLKGLIGKAATCRVKFIETKQYSWHGPIFVPCSTPFDGIPPREEMLSKIEAFNNPPEKDIEAVPEESGRAV